MGLLGDLCGESHLGVLVVGVVEKAKCPKRKKKRLTHFKTMPQAAAKK